MKKSLILAAVAACLALTGCKMKDGNAGKEGNSAPESARWASILKKYRKDDSVSSLLLVKCTEGSNAEVCYYLKSGKTWSLQSEGTAFIGRNGLGKEKEGDGKTPEGDFTATMSFGILPDPGSNEGYIQVSPYTIACDQDCIYYNQIIDSREAGQEYGGEKMFDYSPDYDYGMVLDYNPDNIYPLGSAIFLHCKGEKTFTGGCVAVDEDFMKYILQSCGRGLKVCIHRK